MKAFTYIRQGEFGFTEKKKPRMIDAHDAIVRVTLSSICTQQRGRGRGPGNGCPHQLLEIEHASVRQES